jgi:hypothetical protein
MTTSGTCQRCVSGDAEGGLICAACGQHQALERLAGLVSGFAPYAVSMLTDGSAPDNRTLVGAYAAVLAQLLNDMAQLSVGVHVWSIEGGEFEYDVLRAGYSQRRSVCWSDADQRWVVTT